MVPNPILDLWLMGNLISISPQGRISSVNYCTKNILLNWFRFWWFFTLEIENESQNFLTFFTKYICTIISFEYIAFLPKINLNLLPSLENLTTSITHNSYFQTHATVQFTKSIGIGSRKYLATDFLLEKKNPKFFHA